MNSATVDLEEINLIGLDLGHTTTNKNGQSGRDCGNLWQKFEQEGYANRIPNKNGDELYAVYYAYEGDHTQPFQYFIGYRVIENTDVPEGLDSLTIPKGSFQKITAKGKMPDCIANAWKDIWKSYTQRAYQFDFELYDERSKDWSNAEVDIYLS